MTRRVAWLVALALACGRPARAQDFALAGPGTLDPPATLLEHALPEPRAGLTLAAGSIAWYGVPDLVTRALALSAGHRSWRGACGVSQTGPPGWGWTSVALGAGVAGGTWGAGLRVLARRDRTDEFAARIAPGDGGLEAGAGAWLALTERVTMWASAPSLGTTGAAPPLARPLEAGLRWRDDGLALWLAHRSAAPGYGSGRFVAGVAAGAGPAAAWLEAHDAPLAGAVGVTLARGPLGVSAAVESHPWLPATARLAITLGSGGP